MKNLLLLIIAFILISCGIQDKYSDNLQLMRSAVEKHIEDVFFSANMKITSFELLNCSYDTITENKLDSIRMTIYYERYDKHKNITDKLEVEGKKEVSEYNLYKDLGWSELRDIAKANLFEIGTKMKEQADSMQQCIDKITELENSIQVREDNKLVYRMKCKIKAEMKEINTDTKTNLLEDFVFYFTQPELEMIYLLEEFRNK